MDEIDRLLAKLDNEPRQQPTPKPNNPEPQPAAPSQSLDQLLNQLADGKKQAVRAELLKHPPKPLRPTSSAQPSLPRTQSNIPPAVDPLIAKLKSEQEAQSRAEQLRQEQEQQEAERQQQQQEREKQRRLEALKAQRRAELTDYAKEWLRQLDPRSQEGLWFDEFACNYESRLEAAVEYLEALQSVERGTF
ncbi:MAG: salt stress protein, Slr1339 family [Thainema sp.]